jgi:hypothetical protein
MGQIPNAALPDCGELGGAFALADPFVGFDRRDLGARLGCERVQRFARWSTRLAPPRRQRQRVGATGSDRG